MNYGFAGQRVISGVGVEKGTKAVISANSSAYGELEFNNLRANFFAEIPAKEFFNSHRRLRSRPVTGVTANYANNAGGAPCTPIYCRSNFCFKSSAACTTFSGLPRSRQ